MNLLNFVHRAVALLGEVLLALLALLFLVAAFSGDEAGECVRIGHQVMGGDCR